MIAATTVSRGVFKSVLLVVGSLVSSSGRSTPVWLALIVVLLELAIVIALWRVAKRSVPLVANSLAALIGFAAGCSIGLAAGAGFLFYAEPVNQAHLAYAVLWLLAGAMGFTVALAMSRSVLSSSVPCAILAGISFIYACFLDHELGLTVGGALAVTAIILWALQPRIRQAAV